MVFAIAQAPTPIPGKAPDNSANHGAAHHASADPGEKQTAPPDFIPYQPVDNSKPSHENPKGDAQSPIVVSKGASVSVDRDWVDYVTLGATLTLLVVGYFGVKAANDTLEAVNRQAEIAKETLVAQFRPRVIVRRIVLDPAVETSANRNWAKKRNIRLWKLELHLHNAGGTVAHVRACETMIRVSDSTGQQKHIIEGLKALNSFDIPAGGKHQLTFLIDAIVFVKMLIDIENQDELEREVEDLEADRMFYEGLITYADDSRIERETGFCRIWLGSSGKFAAMNNPDLEYQD